MSQAFPLHAYPWVNSQNFTFQKNFFSRMSDTEEIRTKRKNPAFVIPSKFIVRRDYDPIKDRHLKRFFQREGMRRQLQDAGLVGVHGDYLDRGTQGIYSATAEEFVKIPALIYNKNTKKAKT